MLNMQIIMKHRRFYCTTLQDLFSDLGLLCDNAVLPTVLRKMMLRAVYLIYSSKQNDRPLAVLDRFLVFVLEKMRL